MRRTDRERDAAFAWQVLRDASWGVLALCQGDVPYCVPVNHAAEESANAVYFHCAGAGRKWELLETEPEVCFTAVSRADAVPGKLTTAYDSAVVHGRAVIVRDMEEKRRVLSLLTAALDPVAVEQGIACGAESMKNVQVVKVEVVSITGKQNNG